MRRSATIKWFAFVCIMAKSSTAFQDSFVTTEEENTQSDQSIRGGKSIRQLQRHSNVPRQTDIISQQKLEQLTQEQERYNSSPLSSRSGYDKQSDIIPVCKHVRLDFAKAANGRHMFGGLFVRGEWFYNYGVMIYAEGLNGEKDLHPMIFDSSNVGTNGLIGGDMFSLGSPNYDCGGFGVGRGGREGNPGENCSPLENILIPSRVPGSPNTSVRIGEGISSDLFLDGVLIFEFHNKWTQVESIELLNIMEESEILAVRNDGITEKIELVSVGQNGFQNVYLGLENIERLYITLSLFSGVSEINLCVVVDD